MTTMYPSLAAASTQIGITEYLSTTFALSDPAAGAALQRFLQDPVGGIFRGPYLRVRLPFLPVPEGWENPLGWAPAGFRPYRHQARAFARLSTVDRDPQPTIVTTGTGSGKTESFLIPLLDHARRACARGEAGVKAILLYPMNALVTDQSRRIAGMIASDPALAGVTAGVYIGGAGQHASMGPDHLVDMRAELRANPPDILLTNYRMLDLLLLRQADASLWRDSATSLAFIVLDEFHTYDGAQGTDVAMLLRRLGATLGVAGSGHPLGRICPVATSATLGAGSRGEQLREFAETVFGTPFPPDSLIGEERHTVEELFDDLDFDLEVPDVARVLAAPLPTAADPLSWQPLAEVFLGQAPEDEVALGAALRRHILTRAVGKAIGGDPRPLADAVGEAAKAGAYAWGAAASRTPEKVGEALLRYLTLLSAARVDSPTGARPMVNVEVQVWIREVSRLLREVAAQPRFRWWSDGTPETESQWLPAVYCRACGSSGWQALGTELGEALEVHPPKIWAASLRHSERGRARTLIPAGAGEAGAAVLELSTCALLSPSRGATPAADSVLPVLVTPDANAATRQRCPACDAEDAIRFIGTAVATLVSVSLTQLFGMDSVPESEKKTLVFTDSVQDAAHRAAFVEGRAFQFNFRSAVLRAVGTGPSSLPKVVSRLADSDDADLYLLSPPDFVRRLGLCGEYLAVRGGKSRRRDLAARLALQTQLEIGLNSRVGRTLELTGAMGVHVQYDPAEATALVAEIHQNLPLLAYESLPADAYRLWLQGVLDRVRVRGGIFHKWLEPYCKDDGRRWTIWGGAPLPMPRFPRGRPAPVFLTNRRSDAFDSITSETDTWFNDWTARCLGLPSAAARELLVTTIETLANRAGGPLAKTLSKSGAAVYGLVPESLILTPGSDDDAAAGRMQLVCPVCNHIQPVPAAHVGDWEASPCPRMRCAGRLIPNPMTGGTFYRRLYQQGRLRRIIAAEHTGLLDREEREAVETAFKSGTSPVTPNVLVCTPTLELGIDIGDLSSVTLSSLPRTPANYLQRVGRAGRSTGNALVLAAVPSGPRDLYYFAEPRNLIAGDVVPPSAFLEATELLARQYLAYCLDRVAAGALDLPGVMPAQLGALFDKPLAEGTWLRALTEALAARADELADGFLALFGTNLSPATRQTVRTYAAQGLVPAIATTANDWTVRRNNCWTRVNELNTEIKALSEQAHRDDAQELELRAMRSEKRALLELAGSMGNQESLTGLSELSLLPNYNLIDDSTTLDVSLWWTTQDIDGTQRSEQSYRRGSRMALTEFAPGATFYARGQQITVDAVEPGPPANPAWSLRRLCPSCGWGAPNDQLLPACPRCGDREIADVGAVHKLLPFREASAEQSRDDAVIDEDSDTRERRRYATVTSVDIDSADVLRAWRIKDQPFGAEYATRAVVRTLNLGVLADHGATVGVAGERVVKSAFRTCSACGKWWNPADEQDAVRHRGWCPTRKGAQPSWEELVLSHELHTQAVRMLLPVSMLDQAAHLTAMKGALLLGLRADFGGDTQHLDVVTSSMPDEHGKPRRFLVLHDTVPGGTGYLDRIGDADRMHSILATARTQLATCPCRGEGRAACHRCLLSVLPPREIEDADRGLAVRLLDGILSAWDVEHVETVAKIDIGLVHLSELERRFLAAIKAALETDARTKVVTALGPKGAELDISLAPTQSTAARWRVAPLVNVTAGRLTTQPDFLLTRQDAPAARIAVYLDGREFHASPEHNRTADDAVKRAALRAAGFRVWSITWDDVSRFEDSLGATGKADSHTLVPPAVAKPIQAKPPGGDPGRARLLWGNPINFLLGYLAEPESDTWHATAIEMVLGALRASRVPARHLEPDQLHGELLALAAGHQLPAAGPATTVWGAAMTWDGGLQLVVAGTRADPRATLGLFGLLADDAAVAGSPDHTQAWEAWLRWANVAQFLALPAYGRPAELGWCQFWTTTSVGQFRATHLPLSQEISVGEVLIGQWAEVLEGVRAGGHDQVSAVEELLRDLAARGVAAPEVGYEVGDGQWLVELAWPASRVAFVIDSDDERAEFLAAQDWTVCGLEVPDPAEVIMKELASS